MAFSIRLLSPSICGPDGERLGEICIEDFVERFAVCPVTGGVEHVAERWMHELQMLVSGAAAVGLLTAPNMAWLLYRFGDDVLIHQNLIVPGWDGELSPNGFITRVPHYCSEDDEGPQISEWATTVDAVRAFLDAEGKNATDKIDA